MNLPDFLCVGAQKCGTKWLQQVLEENPNAWLSPVREINFFDRAATGAELSDKEAKFVNRRIRIEEKKNRNADRDYIAYLQKHHSFKTPSAEWYDYIFSWTPSQPVVKGDITPGYLEMAEAGVKYAAEVLGKKKIIILVRSPLERELSQLRMWGERAAKDNQSPQTTEEWIALYRRMVSRKPHGNYKQGIPLWQKYFGEESVMVIPFADIREKPEDLIQSIETFLNIPHFNGYKSLREAVHPTAKAEIPAEVIALAKQKTDIQQEYLMQTFGEEFYSRTR